MEGDEEHQEHGYEEHGEKLEREDEANDDDENDDEFGDVKPLAKSALVGQPVRKHFDRCALQTTHIIFISFVCADLDRMLDTCTPMTARLNGSRLTPNRVHTNNKL